MPSLASVSLSSSSVATVGVSVGAVALVVLVALCVSRRRRRRRQPERNSTVRHSPVTIGAEPGSSLSSNIQPHERKPSLSENANAKLSFLGHRFSASHGQRETIASDGEPYALPEQLIDDSQPARAAKEKAHHATPAAEMPHRKILIGIV